MSYSAAEIWVAIVFIAAGTFAIRISFLGLLARRVMRGWVLRHLRYTPVAVLPGLAAPLVVWPEATGSEADLVRLAAAAVTIGVGVLTRKFLHAMAWGAGVLLLLSWLTA